MERFGPSRATYDQLEVLLASLPHLSHLEASLDSSEIIQEWLYKFGGENKVGYPTLRWRMEPINEINWSYLTHLQLKTSKFRWIKEELAEFSFSLSPLAKLPALKSLHLSDWMSSSPDTHPQIDPNFTLSHLESLTIEGLDSLEPSIAADILNHCPSLLHLELLGHIQLSMFENEFQLGRLFTTLTTLVPLLPSSLQSLRLSCPGWRTLLTGASLSFSLMSPAFVHLRNLEHLRLGINCSTFDQLARTLPKLRSLHLARPSAQELSQLSTLIKSAPHPSLRQVTIDLARSDELTDFAIRGRRGNTLISTTENADQYAKEPGEEDGWIGSTEDFRGIESELREFRERAQEKGISVSGEAVKALEIVEDLEEERKRRERHNVRCFEGRRARKEEFKAERILRLAGWD